MEIKCPKCGTVQSESDTCVKCQVIISKYLKYLKKKDPSLPYNEIPSHKYKIQALNTTKGINFRLVATLAIVFVSLSIAVIFFWSKSSKSHTEALYKQQQALPVDHGVFIQEIRSVLEDPLPPLSEALPGYTRPSEQSPSLLVANLTSKSEDDMPWGRAIGNILRHKIMFSPGIALRMPNINVYLQDAWTPETAKKDVGRSMESVRIVGQRLGIKNALMGNIKIEGPHFELDLDLRELPSGKTHKTFHFSGNVAELPATLSVTVIQIYEFLGIKLSQESIKYASLKTPATFDNLKDFTKLIADTANQSREEAFLPVKKQWDRGIFLPSLANAYFYYIDPGEDLHSYLKLLDEVASAFPENVGIEFTVASYMGYKDAPDLLDMKIKRLQKIIRENPQDPNAMIMLGDVLASSGYNLSALAVCIEALERWPDQYRAWWNISYALNQYAAQLRGRKFWADVPDKGKRMYPPLKDLAYKAVNKALNFNPDMADLWILKMRSVAGFSPELMECFNNAIRLAPNNKYAYATALNFSLPQWGGSYEAQEVVWKLAVKNNPGQPWLQKIRKEYMKEPPLSYKVFKLLSYVLVAIGIIAALVLVWQRRINFRR